MRQIGAVAMIIGWMTLGFTGGCTTMPGGDVVRVTTVSQGEMAGLGERERAQIEKIKAEKEQSKDPGIQEVIEGTPNYGVSEYLTVYPEANDPDSLDFSVGGYDVLDITVYEEPDLARQGIRVSADGYISFPLIGRLEVEGMTPSEIEQLISNRLAEGQFILDAHVSVTVREYRSKQFMVLGSVKKPGSYPIQGKERVLDALSRAGGVDFSQAGKSAMIIRTEHPGTQAERKVVIRVNLDGLLEGGNPASNLLLANEDLLYVPKFESYYIIGQVKQPGSFPYLDQEVTLVEAISRAGGFTPLAARNRTRIVRVDEGEEKIIEVNVDAITSAGKRGQDVPLEPGDVIVVPESFF